MFFFLSFLPNSTLLKIQILFNVSKKEYGNPNTTFKKIIKKYKPIYKVSYPPPPPPPLHNIYPPPSPTTTPHTLKFCKFFLNLLIVCSEQRRNYFGTIESSFSVSHCFSERNVFKNRIRCDENLS